MNIEEIKALPSDAQIIVSLKYIYSPGEVTEELLDFWNKNGAEYTNGLIENNSEITENETRIH